MLNLILNHKNSRVKTKTMMKMKISLKYDHDCKNIFEIFKREYQISHMKKLSFYKVFIEIYPDK